MSPDLQLHRLFWIDHKQVWIIVSHCSAGDIQIEILLWYFQDCTLPTCLGGAPKDFESSVCAANGPGDVMESQEDEGSRGVAKTDDQVKGYLRNMDCLERTWIRTESLDMRKNTS